MTEDGWLASMQPTTMLDHVRGKVSRRKLRLFACACARQLWRVSPPTESGVTAVERGELLADGVPTPGTARPGSVRNVEALTCHDDPFNAAKECAFRVYDFGSIVGTDYHERMSQGAVLNSRMASLLRDIVGNPFHPVAVEPSWLTSTVVQLAAGIYEERAFDRLPILSDALMDAGCDHEAVLRHCRGGGVHARGCWLIDAILGKG